MALKGPSQFAYHLVHAPRRAEEPLIKAFRKWILEEVAETGVPESAASEAGAAQRAAAARGDRLTSDRKLAKGRELLREPVGCRHRAASHCTKIGLARSSRSWSRPAR